MENAIEMVHVTKKFKETVAVNGVTVSLEKGKIHGIIGFNGSGKTVMFKCICGFLKPTGGVVLVDGKEIGKEIDFPESVGIIIENPGFLPDLSGFENLKRLAALNHRIGDEEIRECIRKVGLDPFSKKKVKQYSLGMRERLGIAQAIMEDQKYLILDEPMNGLDKQGVEDVRKLLLQLKEQGKLILIASHNKADIDILCDEVYEMESGTMKRIV